MILWVWVFLVSFKSISKIYSLSVNHRDKNFQRDLITQKQLPWNCIQSNRALLKLLDAHLLQLYWMTDTEKLSRICFTLFQPFHLIRSVENKLAIENIILSFRFFTWWNLILVWFFVLFHRDKPKTLLLLVHSCDVIQKIISNNFNSCKI